MLREVNIDTDRLPDLKTASETCQPGRACAVAGPRAGYILQRLAEASKPFGTKIRIKGDTAEITGW